MNFICVWIDSPGGSPADSLNLANYLAGLDSNKRRTVAYIPNEARGDAAFVAFACDQIVMLPTAILGGPGAAAGGRRLAAGRDGPGRIAAASSARRPWPAHWSTRA